jgi:hypothetical protein
MFSWTNTTEDKWIDDETTFAQTCTVPNDYTDLFNSSINEVLPIVNSDGWTKLATTNGVLIEEKSIDNSEVTLIRTSYMLQNVNLDKLIKHIHNPTHEERKLVYTKLKDHHTLQTFDEHMVVAKSQFNTPYPVVDREFVALRSKKLLYSGQYLISIRSIHRPDQLLTADHVRGTSNSNIYVSPQENNTVKIVSVDHVDPKGWLPGYLVNSFKETAGEWLNNLEHVCQK